MGQRKSISSVEKILGDMKDRADKDELKNRLDIAINSLKIPVRKKTLHLQGNEFGETYYVGALLLLRDFYFKASINQSWPKVGFPFCESQERFLVGVLGGSKILDEFPQGDFSKRPGHSRPDKIVFSNVQQGRRIGTTNNSLALSEINSKILCNILMNSNFHFPKYLRNSFFYGVNEKMKVLIKAELDKKFGKEKDSLKVGIWNRQKEGQHTASEEINQIKGICRTLKDKNDKPIHISRFVLLGDERKSAKKKPPNDEINLTAFYTEDWFKPCKKFNNIGCQLYTILQLYEKYNMVCLIGNRSGSMDGPSLAGVPQIFFEEAANEYYAMCSRMGLTSLCSPFWNQIARLPEDKKVKALSERQQKELKKALIECKNLREDYLKFLKNEEKGKKKEVKKEGK